MNRKMLRILGLLLVMVFVFSGCKKTAPPLLKEISPAKIKAGQGFNIQLDGQSAMWTKTENATKTTVIVWGETQLKTAFGNPNNLSVLVPKEFYAKPGQFQIYLLDNKTNAKSNSLNFTVE